MRRKVTDDDTRTLTRDLPKVAGMVAIFAALASFFPHSDTGLSPPGFKGTDKGNGLTPLGHKTEEFSKAVLAQVEFANKAWAKEIDDFKRMYGSRNEDERSDPVNRERLRRLNRIGERIERIERDPKFGNGGKAWLDAEDADALGQDRVEQRIETTQTAGAPDAPPTKPAPQRLYVPAQPHCDRGYEVARGVVDDDDGTACAPVSVRRAPPKTQQRVSAALREPIRLQPPEAAKLFDYSRLTAPIEPAKRQLTAYAAGAQLPGKATDWLKGIGACVVIWLMMRWAMRDRVRAAMFILLAPLSVAALYYYF